MMSPSVQAVLACVFGIASGTLSGFLGIGGGAILPPLLVFVLGIGQHRAQGISLAALLPPVGLPAVLAYRKGGVSVRMGLVGALIAGFVLGAFGGATVAHWIPTRGLRWCFVIFLLASAWRAISEQRGLILLEPERPTSPASVWVGVPIGALGGLMSGMLGIGGGVVTLPLLRRYGRLGRLEAQATTLAMMLPPIALPAVYVYAQQPGGLPWAILVGVGAGFAGGAAVGALLARRVDGRMAARFYALFLVGTALLLALRA